MTLDTAVPEPTTQRADRLEWTALVVLLLPLLLVSMDVSVLYFAVPFISRDLEPTAAQQLWIFDIYGFVLAGLLITMGALGDRIGRRKLLLFGAGAFGCASVAAAYAGSAELLIGARALLGIGGATLMPSTLGLIRNMFHDEKQRGTAVAIWTAVMGGGVAIGPVLSGLLLEHFWWGSVFLVNLPAMVLLLVLVPVLVPEFKSGATGRFDLTGSALSLATVLPVVYGIKHLAADGMDLVGPAAMLVGLSFGALFVARQRTAVNPMVELALFANRVFSTSIGANTVAMFALVGNAIFTTQYLQSVLGMSPLRAALWSLAPSVAVMAGAPAAAVLSRRIGRPAVTSAGFTIAAAGFVVLTRVRADWSLWVVLIGATLLAMGLVAVMTLVTDAVLTAVSPERAGAASALMETSSELGGALGMALLGSVGAAVYRSDVLGLLPAGLRADNVSEACDTLGGALAVAGRLPAGVGNDVIEAARVAFTHGMNMVALVGAVVLLGAAVASYVLRDRKL